MDKAKFSNLINNINQGNYNKDELLNLYNNAQSGNSNDDSQKEEIIEAVEKSIRSKSPTYANKIFGPKDLEARDILYKLNKKILDETFDLSDNKVKNGVKTGGDMIAGRYFIQVYLSYKNQENNGVQIKLEQKKAESELTASVIYYQGSSDNAIEEIKVHSEEDYYNKYKEFLIKVLPNKQPI